MNTITPNPAEGGVPADGVVTPAAPTPAIGTEQKETVTTEHISDDGVDYREKFINSAKGAQALLDEKRKLIARIAELESNPTAGNSSGLPTHSTDTEILYPGFENLDSEAQENLLKYTEAVTNKAEQKILSRPSIAFAEKTYNESKWDVAFAETVAKFPELAAAKAEFKSQYFNPKNVPDNMSDILTTMAKSYLFDKARDIGAEEGRQVAERVQLEEPTGGDKTPSVHRSLSDWQRIAQENPAKFAAMKKEYEADLASGKLRE
jgi:hypothetical protein